MDDLLSANLFSSNKISLRDIDDFLNQNRLNFNVNGVSLDDYCKELDQLGDRQVSESLFRNRVVFLMNF